MHNLNELFRLGLGGGQNHTPSVLMSIAYVYDTKRIPPPPEQSATLFRERVEAAVETAAEARRRKKVTGRDKAVYSRTTSWRGRNKLHME